MVESTGSEVVLLVDSAVAAGTLATLHVPRDASRAGVPVRCGTHAGVTNGVQQRFTILGQGLSRVDRSYEVRPRWRTVRESDARPPQVRIEVCGALDAVVGHVADGLAADLERNGRGFDLILDGTGFEVGAQPATEAALIAVLDRIGALEPRIRVAVRPTDAMASVQWSRLLRESALADCALCLDVAQAHAVRDRVARALERLAGQATEGT